MGGWTIETKGVAEKKVSLQLHVPNKKLRRSLLLSRSVADNSSLHDVADRFKR